MTPTGPEDKEWEADGKAGGDRARNLSSSAHAGLASLLTPSAPF